MIHLRLPIAEPQRLPFYLAMEEWAARTLPPAEYFFAWRVRPTVICGRNQEMDKEVDMDYCRKAGIDVVRRRSGGGCVYADMDNFMFSYISPGDEITSTFAHYTTMIADVLCSLGLKASATGRNDILVDEKKVSGNAFYHLPGRCIAHGTMLYDFNPEAMRRAITPSRAKLESKSVKSVESRVTFLIASGLTMTHEQFEKYMVDSLCDDTIELSDADIADIRLIEQSYYDPSFLYRKGEIPAETADGHIHRHAHVPGVGEMNFTIATDEHSHISRIEVSGDFFLTGDPAVILGKLQGVPLTKSDIGNALAGTDPGLAIAGLDRPTLIRILANEQQ